MEEKRKNSGFAYKEKAIVMVLTYILHMHL